MMEPEDAAIEEAIEDMSSRPKGEPSKTARACGWCFTQNNFVVRPVLEDFPGASYLVYQEELAPQTGTPHLQGYVRFETRRTFSVVRDYFKAPRPHLECARGTPNENRLYCTKAETRRPGTEPYEFGQCPEQRPGARNDILALTAAVKSGKTFKELTDDPVMVPVIARHMTYYTRLALDSAKPVLRPDLKVTFCVGPAGSGKSTCAGVFEEGDTYVYDRSLGGFWDGYVAQKKVVFDEMTGATLKPTEFNRICDKGSYIVNIKGSSAYLAATDIRVCSNFMPEQWWHSVNWNREAFYRRVTEAHYHAKVGDVLPFYSDPPGQLGGSNAMAKLLTHFAMMNIVMQ